MPLHERALCVCLSLVWATDLTICQEQEQEPGAHEVLITRVPDGSKIEVDGVLDEALWESAARLGPLTSTEPIDGAQPTHPTEVRMACDSENLYVGIICHDEPGDVRALQRQRDVYVRYDDEVQFWFDTFNDQRFAFWFQLSAGGARGDALISDSGSSFNKDWDGIWYGRTKTTTEGWQAEVVLPLKTLAFDVEATRWGFNFRRKRVANGEDSRWASPSVAYRFFALEEGGALVGLSDLQQGHGLDVVPYTKLGYGKDRGLGETWTETEAGIDLTWRPTPSMNIRLTSNTDFAETEIDDRQVNLTRFPLFFPEKRDFFLEDVGVFQFGPSSSRFSHRGGGGGSRGGLMAFYSRTIGRNSEDGTPVPLLAGLKLTGRAGDWNVGVLETLQDSTDLDGSEISEQSLGVVRLSRNLGGENAAGVLFTHGRPDGEGDAMTAGADFRFGSSRFFGAGHSGSLWGYFLATENDGAESARAFGLKANARSATWDHTLDLTRIEDGFDPKLGFVRRTGVDHHKYSAEFTHRGTEGDMFRSVRASISPHNDQDLVGEEDLLQVPFKWLDLEFWSEDSISIETKREFDVLDAGFDLSDEIFVNPGEFAMTRHTLQLDSNERRGIMGYMQVEWGDYYSGDILRTRISPVLLPSALFKWSLSYDDIRIDLEEGDLHTQVVSTDLDFSFDPDLSWQNTAQFDTASEDLSFQSRLHWIVEPGQDMYLVALSGWDRTGRESFARTASEVALKLTYTWRF